MLASANVARQHCGRTSAKSRVISNRIRMAEIGAWVVPATSEAMPTTPYTPGCAVDAGSMPTLKGSRKAWLHRGY